MTEEKKTLIEWSTDVLSSSPIFKQLKPVSDYFQPLNTWPTISQYTTIFKQLGLTVQPVKQAKTVSSYREEYEPRIFLKNELQTRTENWHDFFNALIWLSFPETKKTLNQLHVSCSSNRHEKGKRSLLENRITQFDECGAIIISNNEDLLDLIKQHQWKKLFIEHREQFEKNIKCIIFGHAIFEKSLKPYIGMTCHCLLINDENLLEATKQHQTKSLDHVLAKQWKEVISLSPEKFHPLPILGVPGYYFNQDEAFYSNTDYFRSRQLNLEKSVERIKNG